MRRFCTALVLAFAAFAGPAAAQDDAAIEEVRAAWNRCTVMVEAAPDIWLGWRRNFYNGYGDSFEFWDGYDYSPSLLRVTHYIDGIAVLNETSCYRADGTLAFLLSEMYSPNIAEGGYDGPPISREGHIHVAPDGAAIRTLTSIRDADGAVLAAMDNDRYRLARDCSPAALYATAADVRLRIEAELGDIVGDRPAFEARGTGLVSGGLILR